MTRSLEDPTFAGRVESVETDLAYRVEFAGKSTDTFQVKVFEYPELVRTDAKLVFPSYTSLEPKTVEDIRHVTAVEGYRADAALPAQQRRCHRAAGRRREQGARAESRSGRAATFTARP